MLANEMAINKARKYRCTVFLNTGGVIDLNQGKNNARTLGT
jgi:hypothetical protein